MVMAPRRSVLFAPIVLALSVALVQYHSVSITLGGILSSLLWRERRWQRRRRGFTDGKALATSAVDNAVMCNVDVATDVCGGGMGARPRDEGVTRGAFGRSAFEEEVQVGGGAPSVQP